MSSFVAIDMKRQPITPGCKVWVYSRTVDGEVQELETLMDISRVEKTATGFRLTCSPVFPGTDTVGLEITALDETYCLEVMHPHNRKQVTIEIPGLCMVYAPDNTRASNFAIRVCKGDDIQFGEEWLGATACDYREQPGVGYTFYLKERCFASQNGKHGYTYFLDEDAFANLPNEICYIPAEAFICVATDGYLTATQAEEHGFTFNSILDLCKGQEPLAKLAFMRAGYHTIPTILAQMTEQDYEQLGLFKYAFVAENLESDNNGE